MKADLKEKTHEWELYEAGVDYKTSVGFFNTVDENWRYYLGDQWHGVVSNGLPTPVFNVIKPVIRYKVATVMSNRAKVVYRPLDNGFSKRDVSEKESKRCKSLTRYTDRLSERLKLDYKNESVLTDAAVCGTGISYWYYSDAEEEILMESIDSANLYLSDFNSQELQSQEYVIIAFRRPISEVKREARENRKRKLCSLTSEEIDWISGDDDYLYQAGDMAKKEADKDGNSDKCLCLLKLWRDDKTGRIWMKKSTRGAVYFDETDTGLTRYPVAAIAWEPVKNSFFGRSDVTGMIPNQQYINKIAAMMMLSTMYTAFPKMVYDADRVENPSNQIGVAVAVNSSSGDPIRSIIDYISPASMSADAYNMFSTTISQTQSLMGVSEAALGNINPENASGRAIIATMDATSMPLDSVKRRFYSYLEDVALIWADMINTYNIGGSALNGRNAAEVKIDVGPASRWSELATQETLDNLLSQGYIDFADWVELSPDNAGLPKERLLQIAKSKATQAGEGMRMISVADGEADSKESEASDEDMFNKEEAFAVTPDYANQVKELLSSLSEEERSMILESLPQEFLEEVEAGG